MTKRPEQPLVRKHVMLFEEDWEFLSENYGPGGAKPIGVSDAIRKIVHAKVNGLKARATAAFDRLRQAEDLDNE